MLIDEEEAVELARGQTADAFPGQLRRSLVGGVARRVGPCVRMIQCNSYPAQHCGAPEPTPAYNLGYLASFSQFSADFTHFHINHEIGASSSASA
jgi:hypothetical protein